MKTFTLAATLLVVLCGCSVETEPDPDPETDPDQGGGDGMDEEPPPDEPDEPATDEDLVMNCQEFAGIACGHIFTCMTQEERDAAGVPPTQADCTAALAEPCPEVTPADVCQDGEVYQSEQSAPCVTQMAALTCEQYLAPDWEAMLAESAPACDAMCQ